MGYMDRQEAQLRDQLAGTGIEVQRSGDDLVLNMPSNVTFAYNSDQISPQAASALTQVATTLNQFPETLLTVVGHTDSDGSDAYNMELSRRRASAVSEFLMPRRRRPLNDRHGKSQPIASNARKKKSTQSPGGTDPPQSSRCATTTRTGRIRLLSSCGTSHNNQRLSATTAGCTNSTRTYPYCLG